MSDFLAALTTELADIVTFAADVPQRFHADESGLPGTPPLALIRPRTTAEVARALQICNRFGAGVTPQGGMTGLAGASIPSAGSVALSMERMTAIEVVDPVMATITAQAGATLSSVQAAADEAGLLFGLDLGARDACTIGGNVATNAGGNRVIRYGMMREQVLGLEVVLADGTVVSALNTMLKNNAGYDLKQMFIGSEGTLGVITRAVLRLHAKPASMTTAFCGCPDFDAVLKLLQRARASMGSSLTAFEVMWPSYYDTITTGLPHLRRPFSEKHGVYVLVEASGTDAAHNSAVLEATLAAAFEDASVTDAVVSASERDARDLWAVRDSVSALPRLIGLPVSFDIGLPLDKTGAFVTQIETEAKRRWHDASVVAFGHIGDSNIHLDVAAPTTATHHDIEALVYEAVIAAGGAISAEHGIGLIKKQWLPLSRSPEQLTLMATLKRALDPNGILNPGKVF